VTEICSFHLAHYILYSVINIQSAGFSAASDATKVSVVIGLFKVYLFRFVLPRNGDHFVTLMIISVTDRACSY